MIWEYTYAKQLLNYHFPTREIMLVRDCIMYLNDNFYAGCYFKLGMEPRQEI